MTEWKTIDTAPRDGTLLLLAAQAWEYTHGMVQIGHFDAGQWQVADMSVDDNDADFNPNAESSSAVEDDDDDILGIDDEDNVGPTHWMFLPEPPASFSV